MSAGYSRGAAVLHNFRRGLRLKVLQGTNRAPHNCFNLNEHWPQKKAPRAGSQAFSGLPAGIAGPLGALRLEPVLASPIRASGSKFLAVPCHRQRRMSTFPDKRKSVILGTGGPSSYLNLIFMVSCPAIYLRWCGPWPPFGGHGPPYNIVFGFRFSVFGFL